MSTYTPAVVRDVPRGPRIGHVESQGRRNWNGYCDQCSWTRSASTRPAAHALVRAHVRREHWR